jgi:NADPH2:quinone reductase
MMIKASKTMRVAAIDHFGGPEVLTLHSLPLPVPDPDEVLIALHTAGVGGWDADMRGGWWPEGRPRFPVVLGTDGAGRIAAVGSRVRRLQVGDKVCAYSFNNPKGGFYAEYVAVPAANVAPVPDGLDLKRAGAIPTTGLTALQGIDALQIRTGDSFIIHGASGGVGTLAVQFAKARGARVLATASGANGAALVRRLGSDLAVDGHDESALAAAVRDFAPGGVDAVLAFVGGEQLTQCVRALRAGGKLAYPNGIEPKPRKRSGIDIIVYDAVPGVAEFKRLRHAVVKTGLKVPIAAAYKLEQAREAHERLEAGHVLGKIVLRIR